MDISIIEKLKTNEKIVFGPFCGEIGWELMRWCGFIRWFKKNNPEKQIFVSTRKDRLDLYYNAVDEITTFKIYDDYMTYRPNMYRLDFFPTEHYIQLLDVTKKTFPDSYIFETPKDKDSSNRDYFPSDQMDFNFQPQENNKKIIESILLKHKGKIPVVLSPRHRIDLNNIKTNRNWIKLYWYRLFDMFVRSGKYLVFIVGVSPSFIDPPENNCFEVLETYNNRIDDGSISQIGLTIEAIKHSKITIGNQSSIPILSNILKTPTIMWGHEGHRHSILENPFNTTCMFFNEQPGIYKTEPTVIFNRMERFLC